jgi:DNA-binding transcriptional MerR regulator
MEEINFSRDLLLTIDQISHLTGVRKSTLRYWEKSFDIFLKPARSQSNRREYTMDDLDRVKTIKQLLEQEHLTAYGVRKRLQVLVPAQRKKDSRRPIKSQVAKELGVFTGGE